MVIGAVREGDLFLATFVFAFGMARGWRFFA